MNLIIKTFMRFFFHQLYHRFAWAYDLVAITVSLGRWTYWVKASLEFVQGPRVLELGFGPGHLQRALHENGIRACGLDESWQMASQTTRRLTRRGYHPHLTRGVAQHLPFAAVFDTLIATFPSEYIIDPDSLSEISRVLRPGGKLIVLASATFGNHAFSERAAAWLFRVTGQETSLADLTDKMVTPFNAAGFAARLETRTVYGSTLFFILAQKQVTAGI